MRTQTDTRPLFFLKGIKMFTANTTFELNFGEKENIEKGNEIFEILKTNYRNGVDKKYITVDITPEMITIKCLFGFSPNISEVLTKYLWD